MRPADASIKAQNIHRSVRSSTDLLKWPPTKEPVHVAGRKDNIELAIAIEIEFSTTQLMLALVLVRRILQKLCVRTKQGAEADRNGQSQQHGALDKMLDAANKCGWNHTGKRGAQTSFVIQIRKHNQTWKSNIHKKKMTQQANKRKRKQTNKTYREQQ